MIKILKAIKTAGKKISQLIVSIILTVIYILVIGVYNPFIKLGRKQTYRGYRYTSEDLDKMF